MLDQIKWRRSDALSITTLLTVLGWIVWVSVHVDHWNVVDDGRKGNEALNDRVTVIEAKQETYHDQEMRILSDIRRDLERRQ